MQARSVATSYRVASAPWTRRCKRVSPVCHSTRTEAGTDRPGRTVEAVLLDVGIEASVLGSVKQRNPELSCISVQERVEPLLDFLQSQLQLQPDDLRVMLMRCPRLLSFSMQRQVLPVVEFLQQDLGFDQQQVAATLRRFPGIMGYGVKSHLVPHCHYLKSLGISEEELPQLILTRPHVLGVSIELVITYLRKWLRIERTHVGRLLWSYPLDYSLPRLVLPIDATETADSSMDEPPADPSSSSSSSGGTTSSSAAQASSSNSSGQEEQPRQVPAWGAAEACSWLDIDLKKGSSSSSSSEDGAGGSNNSSSNGDDSPDAGSDGSGGGKQPPSAA